MIFKLYTVLDVPARFYGPVLQARSDELAQRMFLHALAENASVSPDSMQLFCIGEFDDESGEVLSFGLPRHVTVVVPFAADDLTGVK